MDDLYTLLLREYEANSHFMNALHELWRNYRRLLCALVLGGAGNAYGVSSIARPAFAWSAIARLAHGRPKFTRSGVLRRTRFVHVLRYRDDLETLSKRWGLRSDQALERLHVAMLEPFVLSKFGRAIREPVLTGLVRSYGWWAEESRIVLDIPVEDHQTWDEVSRRVVSEAHRQWFEIQAKRESRPGWERVDRRPELIPHIRWLYLRICPQSESQRPLSWHAIARRETVGVTTVTRVVKTLAREMSLELPEVPPGRPPRFPQ